LELADAAGEGDAGAGREDNDVFIIEGGFYFTDAIEAGEGGAVEAEELFGRHLRFDGGERFAEDEIFFAGMHHDVVAGGFDPIDVRHLHEARAVAVSH